MADYRVNLDIYNGPLDLLLYLIRREEVDIYNIPIAHVTEQYIHYVEMLGEVDPNLAGDFMVMAATLMEIKTRMLLPAPTADQAEQEGDVLDPRGELVRQLLQYRAFKDAARELESAGETQSQKFPRRPTTPDTGENEFDLEDVQIWDLIDAFGKLMESIGRQVTQQDVIYDDTPVELHAEDILDRLRRDGAITFVSIFEGRTSRSEIVGLFLALLELVRQRKIVARQGENFSQIYVQLNSDAPGEEDMEVPPALQASQTGPEGDDAERDGRSMGKYVPQPPPGPESGDDDGDSRAEV